MTTLPTCLTGLASSLKAPQEKEASSRRIRQRGSIKAGTWMTRTNGIE